jgi:hypothetical protein
MADISKIIVGAIDRCRNEICIVVISKRIFDGAPAARRDQPQPESFGP